MTKNDQSRNSGRRISPLFVGFILYATAVCASVAIASSYVFFAFFSYGSDQLTDRAQDVTSDLVKYYEKYKGNNICVSVVGNEDTAEAFEFGETLSAERARVVRNALISRGVPVDRIGIINEGARQLLIPTGPKTREPQNRRVQMVPVECGHQGTIQR